MKETFLDIPENFYDKKGNPFMVRCPVCAKENYAMSVASGQCCWCGYTEPKKKNEKTNKG